VDDRHAWNADRGRAVLLHRARPEDPPTKWYRWTEFVETYTGSFAAPIPDPQRPRAILRGGGALPSCSAGGQLAGSTAPSSRSETVHPCGSSWTELTRLRWCATVTGSRSCAAASEHAARRWSRLPSYTPDQRRERARNLTRSGKIQRCAASDDPSTELREHLDKYGGLDGSAGLALLAAAWTNSKEQRSMR
jgi:hypothetical protein